MLSRVPGAHKLLQRDGCLPTSGRVIGLLGPKLMARAIAESGLARLDIVIFTGPALEPWNPETLQATGLGGSETMAWELARHLVLLGHRVRLFGDCAGIDGTFEGVEWLDYRRYRTLSCDVLLTSKQPAAVDAVHNVTAKVRVLWIHDVHYGEKLSPERDARLDAYLCLSAWHAAYFRQHYQRINPNKVFQTRNGLASSAFARRDDETRDPHRVIFSSSPDRGLQLVLDVWPEIRAQVPDATLHVYYGFDNWERMAKLAQDRHALAVIAGMRQQIASVEGVAFHGRANPETLARAFRLAGVWAYPTWFTETSCITAMQAQAAGLQIVTSSLAALNETVGDRGVLLTEDPESEAYKVAFTKATISALRAPADERRRTELEEYAEYHFDLMSLAEDFERFFRRLLSGGVTAFESNVLAG